MAQYSILLNHIRLREMANRFASVCDKANEAAELALKAEQVQHDSAVASAVSKGIVKLSDDIQKIIKLIIDSFTITDQKVKKIAENIVGVEIHKSISSGETVFYDMNGNRYVKTDSGVVKVKSDYIDSINPPRQVQIRRCNSDGFNSNEGGICNISSVTTLLNRRYVLDYGQQRNDYFTPEDSFKANGCTDIKYHGNKPSKPHKGQDYYQYNGGTAGWANGKTYSNGSGASYTTHAISANSAKNEVNSTYGGSYNEYVAHLLEEHPEGICIRNAKSNHVAVITGYTREPNGNISIQVEDPVNNYKGNLEGSWIYSNDSDKGNFWNHLDSGCAFTYLS